MHQQLSFVAVAMTSFVVDIIVGVDDVFVAIDDVTFQLLLECLIQLFNVRMKNHQVGLFFRSFAL